MQNIFSIYRRWHDPVTSLKRAVVLTISILLVEALGFFLKDRLSFISPIYLLGFLRTVDIFILLIFGPWSFKRPDISDVIMDCLYASLFFSMGGLFFLMTWKFFSGSSMLKAGDILMHKHYPLLFAFYITSCLLSPVAEELFFRGILYRKMREKWSIIISVLVLSSLFALIHLYFSGQGLVPFAGSLIFCFGYEKTKFILAPVLLHIIGNSIIYLSPFLNFI